MKAAELFTVTTWLSGLAAALPSVLSNSNSNSNSNINDDKLKYYFPRQSVPQYASSFDPNGNSVLAVYYGKAQYTQNPLLWDLCSDSDVDMIVMGFVRQLNGPYVQPSFDIGACKTPSQRAANYTGITCPTLAANITRCQSMGKKVMISLGGSSSNLVLSNVSDAQQAATILWNVFGAGTGSPNLRPFGNVTLDGFDFDLEGGADTSYTDVLSASLQNLFTTASPARYISASPLCANNTVMPYDFYKNANFIWPRFYNANACKAGGKGYNKSVTAWSNFLTDISSNVGVNLPRFYIGALSFENYNSGGGYMAPDAFGDLVEYTKDRVGKARFGGVTFWQGTDAFGSKSADGRDILNVTKEALLEPFTSDACGTLDTRVLAAPKLIRRQISYLIGKRAGCK
ncbi:glycoside hydrolase [Aureobasidium subglaciale]|nr:glycoside hydrolase [Aureobasidium subglaciale]KAI5264006.1 glycoside hydrolase [Aureobasidium subglaciale]